MYRILGGDGKEYGPIDAATIRQWLKESRLGAQSQVRAEGRTEWKRLTDFPELLGELRASAGVPNLPSQPMPATAPRPDARTSGLAVASVVLGALGCAGVTAIAGLVCGLIALGKINKSEGRQRGKGLAITGMALSVGMLVLALPIIIMAGLLLPAMASAKDKAQAIHCMNNLRQVSLGLRIYSMAHNGTLPPDFLSMSNELGSPIILICPSDPSRTRPASSSWINYNANQTSYEYLAPSAAESSVTSQVVVRCPIHGNVCLGDGSVQRRKG
jgi:hypothetical protein